MSMVNQKLSVTSKIVLVDNVDVELCPLPVGGTQMSGVARTVGIGEIFQVIRAGEQWTRSELAHHTGQARSTISAKVDALEKLGLVGVTGEASSTGGRRPATFAFSPSSRSVIGIDLGAAHVRIAVTDLGPTILGEYHEAISVADGPVPVLDRIIAICRELMYTLGEALPPLGGVAIGVPGPVEAKTGKPVSPPIMPGWDGFDIVRYLGQEFGVPITVDNDVNLMAVGEHRSRWMDHENLLYVKVSTGIGSGIIMDGKLRRGAQGSAGDIGHIVLADHRDLLCRCGNYGCLEAVAGGAAIEKRFPELGGLQGLVTAAKDGDPVVRAALREAGREIGFVVSACVSILNPSLIVVGGSMVEAGEYLIAGLREVLYQNSMPLATEHLQIVVSSNDGQQSGVLGGAHLAIDKILSAEAIDQLCS